MTGWLNDVRYALRQMRRNPVFTSIAVATLALGACANIVMFSVSSAVLLRPLPYPHADRLYQIVHVQKAGAVAITTGTKFLFWRDHNRTFREMAAYEVSGGGGFTLTGAGDPERVESLGVSTGFFTVLGVRPQLGRDFVAEDGQPGGARVCIVSYELWQRRFGGRPSIVGQSIRLGGEPYTVVGIAPGGLTFAAHADLWIPLRPVAAADDNSNMYFVIGRLRADASPAQAEADLAAVGRRFREVYPGLVGDDEGVAARPYQESLVAGTRPALLLLQAAVGLVLLIACANVANLLLARGSSRRHEILVRAALGATRAQVARQLLTESLLLALCGVALGVALTPPSLGLLAAISPIVKQASLDRNVVVFAVGLALLTALLFGAVPVARMSREGLHGGLGERGGHAANDPRKRWLQPALVSGQMALSMVLVVGATLLMTSFIRLSRVDTGFDRSGVLTFKLSLSGDRYATTDATTRFLREVNDRIQGIPGVRIAGTALTLPLQPAPDGPFEIAGNTGGPERHADMRQVTPGFFEALHVRLVAGRRFADGDDGRGRPVAIVNEALARRYYPRGDALGQVIRFGSGQGPLADAPREIVGIVGDMRDNSLNADPRPAIFTPLAQNSDVFTGLFNRMLPRIWFVRTAVPPLALQTEIRRAILAVDPDVAPSDFRTLDDVVGGSLARERFDFVMSGTFAGLALLLAALGLYGVLSYLVARRTHEIGIRCALGASQRDILQLILGQGMRMAAVGLAVGLLASFGATRFLRNMLFGVALGDVRTLVLAGTVLVLVAGAACAVPARRAARLPPALVARGE